MSHYAVFSIAHANIRPPKDVFKGYEYIRLSSGAVSVVLPMPSKDERSVEAFKKKIIEEFPTAEGFLEVNEYPEEEYLEMMFPHPRTLHHLEFDSVTNLAKVGNGLKLFKLIQHASSFVDLRGELIQMLERSDEPLDLDLSQVVCFYRAPSRSSHFAFGKSTGKFFICQPESEEINDINKIFDFEAVINSNLQITEIHGPKKRSLFMEKVTMTNPMKDLQ